MQNLNMMKGYDVMLKSFGYAFTGLRRIIDERNMKIHIVVFIIVLFAGAILNISPMEWMIILIVSGVVFAAETFNTAIETLSDRVCGAQYDDAIKVVKDWSATAVLILSVAAALIGVIIFLPKITTFSI